MQWQKIFEQGWVYGDFLDRYAKENQRERWHGVYERITLSDEQSRMLKSFTRSMNVVCLAGAWCGDCVNQCPILQRFADVNPVIQLRFVDRDAHPDLSDALSICGGHRVPMVVFLSEDHQECGRTGDRTLSKYREMAGSLEGAACPTGLGQETSLLQAVTQEWLNEFERIQWMLRLSPRLREKHGD